MLTITSNVARKCGHKNWDMQHHGRVTTTSFEPGSCQQMLRGGLLAKLGPQVIYSKRHKHLVFSWLLRRFWWINVRSTMIRSFLELHTHKHRKNIIRYIKARCYLQAYLIPYHIFTHNAFLLYNCPRRRCCFNTINLCRVCLMVHPW